MVINILHNLQAVSFVQRLHAIQEFNTSKQWNYRLKNNLVMMQLQVIHCLLSRTIHQSIWYKTRMIDTILSTWLRSCTTDLNPHLLLTVGNLFNIPPTFYYCWHTWVGLIISQWLMYRITFSNNVWHFLEYL